MSRGARTTRHATRALALAVAAGCAAAFPTPAAPATAAPPEVTCGWSPRIGAGTFNVAFPDTFADYWMTLVPAAPGTSVTLRGQFPHARYMSFVSYSSGTATGILTDTAITPDTGSVNPFPAGADRQNANRSYTIRVIAGDRPANPEPDTLYAPATDGVIPVIYRVYRPDTGRDAMGGTGLPRATVGTPGGGTVELADCAASTSDADPHGVFPESRIRAGGRATPPPHAPQWAGRDGGGLFPNPDNKYLATLVDSGRTAVVRGRLPRTPDTFSATPRMESAQLRYWSICSGDGPSTSTLGCLVDDEIPLDGNGEFTIVVSAPENRPDPGCGIAWLPANSGETLLIMRNMLPAADFPGSIQNADPENPEPVLGPYYPEVTYPAGTDGLC
ncbi:hypothetical protein ACWCPQ_33130 [Nocardia sp. NPDC001965]